MDVGLLFPSANLAFSAGLRYFDTVWEPCLTTLNGIQFLNCGVSLWNYDEVLWLINIVQIEIHLASCFCIFQVDQLDLNIPKDSVFYRLCDKALISFTDFVFLLVILSSKFASSVYSHVVVMCICIPFLILLALCGIRSCQIGWMQVLRELPLAYLVVHFRRKK